MKKIELLAPAGDFSKLKSAFYYGADAVYIGGKSMSLRALAGNFTDEELAEAVSYARSLGKKVYVTVNIFAKNSDLPFAEKYFKYLESLNIDGAIISDPGLIYLAKSVAPKLKINISTQANVLNKMTVKFWKEQGADRVILARELSLAEIKEIHEFVPDIEIETFIHGAMCISYSGRCLLSNYLTGRESNRGACVQSCRWEYEIREKTKGGDYLTIQEDDRGTYILNSKDLNLMDYIAELADAGVVSFKIEGRMKSEYYLSTVINAYRRAIDGYYAVGKEYKNNPIYQQELKKTAHRSFTTAYLLGNNAETVNYDDSQSKGNRKFIASVLGYDEEKNLALIEMRNRFTVGEVLEVLSPSGNFNKTFTVMEIYDETGKVVEDAKIVQQKLYIKTDIKLFAGDILRKEVPDEKVK